MQSFTGYKEIDVPPHILKLFNEVFDKNYRHCVLYIRPTGEKVEDSEVWSVMVDSMENGNISRADDDEDDDEDEMDDLLSDDYVPTKKITWH